MNKRNFGAVIKAIEKDPETWEQGSCPNGKAPSCGTPCCFLGHAEYLRTGKRTTDGSRKFCIEDSPLLGKWLGLDNDDMYRVFDGANTLDDFKRWHKAGSVS